MAMGREGRVGVGQVEERRRGLSRLREARVQGWKEQGVFVHGMFW